MTNKLSLHHATNWRCNVRFVCWQGESCC